MPWEWLLPFALIPAIWAGLCVAIASFTGWSRLVERYRAEREPDEGPRWNFSALEIGWCGYNGCVVYRVAPEGLYIAIWSFFVGHPALLIPWAEFRHVEVRPSRWAPRARCDIGDPKIATLNIPLAVVQSASVWLPPQKTGE